MSSIRYRGIDIRLSEVENRFSPSSTKEYQVVNSKGLVFVAESEFGYSFANNGVDALAGALRMIDRKLQ